ncbi:MAG: hypothetical protein A2845_05640 [Candidatus Lloydbacteria bacterium RIFCSPHIGHO2_01_FULL_49_22]|uniref:CARD domain-containing protein n=1 Tax=Candidatus Lloydbacteria bacterium RIFCSPHIGHO2_01_FULL_49_22 TaxID=1798658 RepID=A0A1G2CTW8_9BACT|nr:MAG: hypothetical protein A2845_05640 [Candidatus Lloydbacteria bacterium RIFCSPHIGHO2_01_FULL_49_22]OGZ09679.1 MAG: hypothetical protein A3C14_02950 [Candidatus Lloydbacteria bacterium RIFCSPHIGHO2_02_FULL_50_18]
MCYIYLMDDKKAIEVLLGLIEKGVLNEEETEAVRSAIGVLSWTSLAESRLRSLKAKKEKSRELDDRNRTEDLPL